MHVKDFAFEVLNGETLQHNKQPTHHVYTVKKQLLSPKLDYGFFLYKMEL